MIKFITSRPRLFLSFLMGVAVVILLPQSLALHLITRLIIGWNVTTVLYLLLATQMIMHTNHRGMRLRAQQQNEGEYVVLAMVVIAAVVSLGAIVLELGVVKELTGFIRKAHVVLAVMTIFSSWAFTQMMFALHYAHGFYTAIILSR